MLWGTRKDNRIESLGASKGLARFLNQIGATDAEATATAVQNMLRAFKQQGDFEAYSISEKPVAIRYAPMHLYQLPNMPSTIKPFCALAISGAELAERDTFYTQTFIFSRSLMHRAGEYTYLDFLFGNHILTAKELAEVREGRRKIDFDRMPRRITPELAEPDLMCVAQTVEALFAGKNVVIRLEKEDSFNQRAIDLLSQIYSLLPPRFATEVGFSTYQDPSGILELIKTTSIRIFVLSPEADLEQVPAGDTLLIDLNGRSNVSALERNDVTLTINEWMRLPWATRRPLMETAFSNTETNYHDPVAYVQISKDCFAAAQAFEAWARDTSVNGTVTDLTALQVMYEAQVNETRIPWAKERFIQRIPLLLAKGKTLSSLLNEAAYTAYYGATQEVRQNAAKQYVFGSDFSKLDENIVPLIAKGQKQLDAVAAADAIAKERALHTAEIARCQEQYEATIKQNETAHKAELAKAENALQEQQREAEALKQKHTEAMDALRAEACAAVTKRDQKIAEQSAALEETRTDLRRAEATVQQLQAEAESKEEQIRQLNTVGYRRSGHEEPEEAQLNPKKKWMLLGIGFAAATVIVSTIFLLIMLLGGSDKEEVIEPSTSAPIVTTVPTTLPPETTTEPPTETEPIPTEPEPVSFMGWDDPVLAEHMVISVDGVAQVASGDAWYLNDITVPDGYEVLTAISSEEEGSFALPKDYALVLRMADSNMTANHGASQTGANTSYGNETQPDTGNEASMGTDSWSNQLSTDSTTEPSEPDQEIEKLTVEEWFALSEKITLVFETDDVVILSVGGDSMHEAAFQTLAWSAENEYIDVQITTRLEDGKLLDLTEKLALLYVSQNWWHEFEDFSTDPAHMGEVKTVLNTNPYPVLTLKFAETEIAFFDYGEDEEKAVVLAEIMNERTTAEADGSIVTVLVPLENSPVEP